MKATIFVASQLFNYVHARAVEEAAFDFIERCKKYRGARDAIVGVDYFYKITAFRLQKRLPSGRIYAGLPRDFRAKSPVDFVAFVVRQSGSSRPLA